MACLPPFRSRRPTGRARAALAVAAAALSCWAAPRAQAQPPAPADSARRAELDSLAARLARAEAAIALLRQQLATESESALRTRSRLSAELSARLLTNAYWTSAAANDVGVPTVAAPRAPGARGRAAGASLRQSRVSGALTVREVLGGTFDGDVDVDFFGGGRDAAGNRPLFPEPRLRTARAWLRWARGAVMVGSETPLVSDLDPLSLAAIGVPLFGGAGNLWNWLPQARGALALGRTGPVRWGAQGAVLAPYAGVATVEAGPGGEYSGAPGGDAAERSGRPALEGRLRARWGAEDPDAGPDADVRDVAVGEGPSEIGVGLHRGWLRPTGGRTLPSHGATVDARIAFARRWELRGEAYAGRLIAGLGGGGIAQSFGAPPPGAALGAPVRDVAGWAQLNVAPTTTLLGGAGCGVDRVRDADRADRRRNAVCGAHLRWRPAQPLLLGLEWRRLATRYANAATYVTHHVNLALGFEL